MNNVTLRKYFMSRIDSLQREVEFLKESVTLLDNEESKAQDEAPKAEAAPKKEKAAPKKEKAAPKAEVTERPTEEIAASDDDDFLNDQIDEEMKAPTVDDVRAVVKEFAVSKGKDKALKLLNKFGTDNVAKLQKSDYQAVIDLAKRYL